MNVFHELLTCIYLLVCFSYIYIYIWTPCHLWGHFWTTFQFNYYSSAPCPISPTLLPSAPNPNWHFHHTYAAYCIISNNKTIYSIHLNSYIYITYSLAITIYFLINLSLANVKLGFCVFICTLFSTLKCKANGVVTGDYLLSTNQLFIQSDHAN